LAIGRVVRGSVKAGQELFVLGEHEKTKGNVKKLFVFEGLKRVAVEGAAAGEVVAIAGLEDATIGDTICDRED
ncbi:EF-Tu/IF-2/RF-3 family GTPase, partial [Lactococcus formosensis]